MGWCENEYIYYGEADWSRSGVFTMVYNVLRGVGIVAILLNDVESDEAGPARICDRMKMRGQ